ncbi:unnamed protein product [Effrenium voratum]|uniref:Uncharacterized protein n=1 Tax=Effrenium voratum TaxID=2562239 RepID=A0AA36JL01_9DINO|nr:unnamed protein product [Effrenium voratum]CAJ1455109.1 unnamed protein product [Effrenium voratum]
MAKPIVITLKRTKADAKAEAPQGSPSRSRSPSRGSEPSTRGPLDTAALEQHVGKFQEDLNAWLKAEAEKLGKLQKHGQELQSQLAEKRKEVSEFLQEHGRMPEASLASMVQPLAKLVEEDKRALAGLALSLQEFAAKAGVSEKEQKAKGPELLKVVLRQCCKEESEEESYSYSD